MSRRVAAGTAVHKPAAPRPEVRLSVPGPAPGSVPEVEGQARQHHNLTLAILATAGTAFALQQTMVIPALPALQHDLHTTTTWVTWVLTVFLLVASVATPILGKLG